MSGEVGIDSGINLNLESQRKHDAIVEFLDAYLEQVRAKQRTRECHRSYFVRFPRARYTANERKLHILGYNLAKDSHRGQTRKTGERYFEHPRAASVVLRLMGFMELDLHILALNHDIREDRFQFSHIFLESAFDRPMARMIRDISKPKPGDPYYRRKYGRRITKDELVRLYYEDQLANSVAKVLLVKLADRLHNVWTLSADSTEDQVDKVKETIKYFPGFIAKIESEYPEESLIFRKLFVISIERLKLSGVDPVPFLLAQ